MKEINIVEVYWTVSIGEEDFEDFAERVEEKISHTVTNYKNRSFKFFFVTERAFPKPKHDEDFPRLDWADEKIKEMLGDLYEEGDTDGMTVDVGDIQMVG